MWKQPRHNDETDQVHRRQNREPDQADGQLVPVVPPAILAQLTVAPSQLVTLSSPRVMPIIEVKLIDRGFPAAQDQRPAFLAFRCRGIVGRRGLLCRPSPIVGDGLSSGSWPRTRRRASPGTTDLLMSRVTRHIGPPREPCRPTPRGWNTAEYGRIRPGLGLQAGQRSELVPTATAIQGHGSLASVLPSGPAVRGAGIGAVAPETRDSVSMRLPCPPRVPQLTPVRSLSVA